MELGAPDRRSAGSGRNRGAEDLRFDRISVEDGLAHTSVWDVAQDSRGFVWIATESYLQRYDGYELKAYKHDPEDPESLSASEVTEIYEDRRGNLWFGTRSAGLNRFDRAEERFVRYGADPSVPGGLLTGLCRLESNIPPFIPLPLGLRALAAQS